MSRPRTSAVFMHLAAAAALAAASASQAASATQDSVQTAFAYDMPSSLAAVAVSAHESANAELEMPALKKVGEARLKVLLWSIYDASLFTSSGIYDESERPLRLEIQYRLGVKSGTLVERTRSEWSDMGRTHPHQDAWLENLAALWPDIREDDVLTLELDTDNVSTFLHNGEVLGRLEDPEFGQQFLDIWASEDCTRPQMRLALIGKAR